MKLLASGAIIGWAALAPQIAGQNQAAEQKHLATRTNSAQIDFAADNILREDPPAKSASPYTSVVRLRGNVQIRTCCVQVPYWKGEDSEIPPKQLVLMLADEADFHEDTGEMEVRGNVRVNFQNYPNP